MTQSDGRPSFANPQSRASRLRYDADAEAVRLEPARDYRVPEARMIDVRVAGYYQYLYPVPSAGAHVLHAHRQKCAARRPRIHLRLRAARSVFLNVVFISHVPVNCYRTLTEISAMHYNSIIMGSMRDAMREYITVDGISYEIRRNARRKSIALGVDDGSFFIAAPMRASRRSARGSYKAKRRGAAKEAHAPAGGAGSGTQIREDELFYYRGEQYPLRFVRREGVYPLKLEDGAFLSFEGARRGRDSPQLRGLVQAAAARNNTARVPRVVQKDRSSAAPSLAEKRENSGGEAARHPAASRSMFVSRSFRPRSLNT